MNDNKFTTKEIVKEVEVNGDKKKVKIKIEGGKDYKIKEKDKDQDDIKITDVKILEGEEAIKKDIDKEGVKGEIVVKYKGDATWWPHLEIKKVNSLTVKSPDKARAAVKGGWTWTAHVCIWGAIAIAAVLVIFLVWSLFKKDDESAED